ncbi:cathepsin K-like [Rhinophrynus dorsalis]
MHLDKHLLVFATIIFCASAAHFLDQEWTTWKSKYGKKYVTPDNELFRRKAWEANWEKVQKHNQLADQGLKSYRMETNHFADMTSEEMNSKSCILPSTAKSLHVPMHSYGNNMDIPKEVDWRKSNCVAPAKNQGICGSCWAFATVGVIESRYCIKKGDLMTFSEQQLVDCDDKDEGCCGGVPLKAMYYVAHNGIMKSKDYEYKQAQFTCLYKNEEAIKLNISKFYSLVDEENMASAVALDGPVTVGIASSDDLQLYSEGIFDGGCAEDVNHAIIIVGYGTEPAKNEGEEATDYWIIKNSWGEEWGEKGFAKVKRNVNQCKIEEMVATADILL